MGCADEPAWVSKSPVLERECKGYVEATASEFILAPPEKPTKSAKKHHTSHSTPANPFAMRAPSPFSMKA